MVTVSALPARFSARIRFPTILLLAVLPSACAGPQWPFHAGPEEASRTVWVLDQGWHTEIGIPAQDLSGPLAVYRDVFPGASVLMFGFGKRTWMTAKVDDFSELLVGPFPGPGAIEVVGLRTTPDRAFGGADVIQLSVSPEGERGLAGFVWQAIGKTGRRQPRLISRGRFPGSLFYAARQGYALDQTCNTWTAEALHSAGLDVDPGGVVFAGGVIRQLARLPGARLVQRP